MQEINRVIEEKIRPVLNAHNGDLELLEVTADGYVKVRLTGACAAAGAAGTGIG